MFLSRYNFAWTSNESFWCLWNVSSFYGRSMEVQILTQRWDRGAVSKGHCSHQNNTLTIMTFFLFLLAFCDTAKGEIFANPLWFGECKDQWKLTWSQTCLIIRFSWKGCVNNQKRISFQACNITHHSLQAESSLVTSSPPFPLSMCELSMACFF